MKIKLENLEYQEVAIKSVVKVFHGNEKNNFDNACIDGIRSNLLTISEEQLTNNIVQIISENGIETNVAKLSNERELTVEMETGTGKTLVYIKTICELYKEYAFSKFIILVPSVAIRQGVLSTLRMFEKQLTDLFGFTPKYFEYNSKKLNNVTNFIEEQHPQIMIMTLASFNSEDKILNQTKREDLFANIPFIDAIGRTNPIILMDEPQEGMDTENSEKQISKLNPLFKIRYSATHKVIKNLVYRLTPFDSYRKGLVKKIEVLTVTEKNDEATLKLEYTTTQIGKGDPKAKIKAWHKTATGKIEFKDTGWLNVGDNIGEKTKNPSYNNYTVERINKSLRSGKWSMKFTNGAEIFEKQTATNIESIWDLQLEWLIIRHFTKKQHLQNLGIKCLSLIFIDKVANYMGEEPIIKNLFIKKYKSIYPEFHDGKEIENNHIESIQGYYFAKSGKGEFTDSESAMRKNSDVFDAILRDKEELLTYGESVANKIEFIFSHSALGVGWDNPNIFNIATLSNSYSEIKKRQEIGRGLRICVNDKGQRVYDNDDVPDNEKINQLTVIPNETYEAFVMQYQEEIKEVYGTTAAAAGISHSHKGTPQNEIHFKRNKDETVNQAFKRFWSSLAKKTDFTVAFDEESLIARSIQSLNTIIIEDYQAEVKSTSITDISQDFVAAAYGGSEIYKLNAYFSPLDIIDELSENTGLSYPTVFRIIEGISNYDQVIRNPPIYIHIASSLIKNIELDEMGRGLTYHVNNEKYPFIFDDFIKNVDQNNIVSTPQRGVFDKMLVDSLIEVDFAKSTDSDNEVICFLKLPKYYKIPTPIGDYEPDFGIVMRRKQLRAENENEFYFVVETKGTNDINDKKALKQSEVYKIEFAKKHFAALGIEIEYKAPVKDYSFFKKETDNYMSEN